MQKRPERITWITALLATILTATLSSLAPGASAAADIDAQWHAVRSGKGLGVGAPVVLSPGKRMAEARREIAEMTRAIQRESANKNERAYVQEWKRDQLQPADFTAQKSGDGELENSFAGGTIENGNIVLGYRNGSRWCPLTDRDLCHAGLWDDAAWRKGDRDKDTAAIRTSNTGRGNQSVYLESPDYWQKGFKAVAELKVIRADSPAAREQAIQKAATYQGIYWLDTWKWDSRRWYCSKVVWRAYFDTASIDIDGDGGYWVFPSDIWNSTETALIRWWL